MIFEAFITDVGKSNHSHFLRVNVEPEIKKVGNRKKQSALGMQRSRNKLNKQVKSDLIFLMNKYT